VTAGGAAAEGGAASLFLEGLCLLLFAVVMQRYWFLEFDTISIRYCQNIAISIRYRYFISKYKLYVSHTIPGNGVGGWLSCTVFAYSTVKLLVWAT